MAFPWHGEALLPSGVKIFLAKQLLFGLSPGFLCLVLHFQPGGPEEMPTFQEMVGGGPVGQHSAWAGILGHELRALG